MGYRSDVRIIMSKNGFNKFKKYVEDHIRKYKLNNIKEGSIAATYNYDYNLLNNLDVSKASSDGNQIYIGWDNLKWYDGYEEVDSIMDSLNKLEKNGYGYRYVRIGESFDDIEKMEADNTAKDGVKYLDYPGISRGFDDFEYKDIDLSNNKRKDNRDDR